LRLLRRFDGTWEEADCTWKLRYCVVDAIVKFVDFEAYIFEGEIVEMLLRRTMSVYPK